LWDFHRAAWVLTEQTAESWWGRAPSACSASLLLLAYYGGYLSALIHQLHISRKGIF